MTKVVLITSGQPSLNPRLVKEADTLVDLGFSVTVIYQYWSKWATDADLKLLASKNWKAICVGGSPFNNKYQYFKSRLVHKASQLMAKYFGLNNGFAELALKRNVNELIKKTKSTKANLYIAHNLGALPAAVLAAKKNNVKCGFDAEDFHRQEVTDDVYAKNYQLAKYIEDKYLPKVNYLTTASPLIAKAYQDIYPQLKPVIVNNVFPIKFLQKPKFTSQTETLKLFWFSQTIGRNRGIEDAIAAIGLLKKENISLTLLGNIDETNQSYFLSLAKQGGLVDHQLIFIEPIDPNAIFKLVSKYDIGLALEPGFCLNNHIALSNKIFTYLTSGLAVIASETSAQKEFLSTYPTIGHLYPIGNINKLAAIIEKYNNDRELLYLTKIAAHSLAQQTLNWETESKKFIKLINNELIT